MNDAKSNSESMSGLTESEAASRLKAHGYNELPTTQNKSVWVTARGVVREPMFLLLLAFGTLYLLLGDVQEALMSLGFVFVVLGITFYQERKTERALEALRARFRLMESAMSRMVRCSIGSGL